MTTFRLIGLSMGGILLMAALIPTHPDSPQPIQYNHAIHVEDLSMGCLDCHPMAETGTRASIPNIEMCGTCHTDTEAENPDLRKIAETAEQGGRIPWEQVHLVADYAYFSHRRHVGIAGLQCDECHGDVSQMEVPFLHPFVTMDMDWCLDCHQQRGVSNDCYTCHR